MENIENSVSKFVSFFILLFGVFVIMTFQNCGVQEDGSALATDAPFAFDTVVDTFGAMSCTYSNIDQTKYFHFKLGGYRPFSGIKLTEDFRNHIGVRSAENIAEILALSDENSGATLQLSVRSTTDFQDIRVYQGSESLGVGYNNFLANLDSANIATALGFTDSGVRLNEFTPNGGLETSGIFETSFYLGVDENNLGPFRADLASGTNSLMMTYASELQADSGGKLAALAPTSGSKTSVYGSRFFPEFTKVQNPSTLEYLGYNRYLGRFTEFSAETGSQVTQWQCYNFVMYPDVNTAEADDCGFPVTRSYNGNTYPFNPIEAAADVLLGKGKFHISADTNGKKFCLAPVVSGNGPDTKGCYIGHNPIATASDYSTLATCDPSKTPDGCPHIFAFCMKP